MQMPQHLVPLIIATTLTVVSFILYMFAQNDAASPLFLSDRRVIYTYKPRQINLDAVNTILQASFIDHDTEGTKLTNSGFKCNTPAVFGLPTVRFSPNITALAKCPIHLKTTAVSGGYVRVQLDRQTGATAELCPTNTNPGYQVLIKGDGVEKDSGLMALIDMTAATTVTFSPNTAIPSITFTLNNQHCTPIRSTLIDDIHNRTDCVTEGSQFCSCVRRFTNFLSDNEHQNTLMTPASDTTTVTKLSDVAVQGIKKCADLRRQNDVRTPLNEQGFKLSYTLILFAISILCNCINTFVLRNNYFGVNDHHSGPIMTLGVLLLVHALVCILLPLAGSSNGYSEQIFFLAIEVPAVLLGLYVELPDLMGWELHKSYDPTLLHPFYFDAALQALTLFALLARGVVQYESLAFELVKAHGISFVYALVMWFNLHKKDDSTTAGRKDDTANKVFNSAYTQEAYLILFTVAALASIDSSLFIPYPSEAAFRPFWLLPGAFVVFNLINRVWVGTLRIRSAPSISHYAYFSDLTSTMLFAFWIVFLGWFMERHLRLYNSIPANDKPWPSVANLGLNGVSPTSYQISMPYMSIDDIMALAPQST